MALDTLQQMVDETIASWPDVGPKQVFGHRGYVRGGKMFAFLAEGGLAVKAATEAERDALYRREGVKPFVYGGKMVMRQWPVLPLREEPDVAAALSAAQRAIDAL